MNLFEMMTYLKSKIKNNNYANHNYEIAVAFSKAIALTIKDKEIGKNNYYNVHMTEKNYPNIDAYIFCTTEENNDYALQIKSGTNYNIMDIKTIMYVNRHKNACNPSNYLLVTWKNKKRKIGAHYSKNIDNMIQDDNIKDILNYIDLYKNKYKKEYTFLLRMFNQLNKFNNNKQEADWIDFKIMQAEILDKQKIEKRYLECYV